MKNELPVRFRALSIAQLKAVDEALDVFIFSQGQDGEAFAPTYKKNPKHFRKLLTSLVAFKRDVMSYFKDEYDRWPDLVNYPNNGYPNFNRQYWEAEDTELAKVIEKHTATLYDLGVDGLIALGAVALLDHSSANAQTELTNHAVTVAKSINQTTMDRIQTQIDAAMALNDDRDMFAFRLDRVLGSPYRGRFIAQQEGMQAYLDAQANVAQEGNMKFKTWVGPQATDDICGGVDGETVPIDQPFSNGLMAPLAHFGCLCSVEYSDTQ